MRIRAMLVVALLASAPRLASQPTPLAMRVTRVTTWKNGVAALTREGDVPQRAGSYALDLPESPIHGTFWIGVPEGVRVSAVDGRIDPAFDPLATSEPQPVVVRLRDGDGEIRGTLRPTRSPAHVEQPFAWANASGAFLAIDVGGTTELVARDRISSVRLESPMPAPAPAHATIHFDRVRPGRFEITWLARGIAWAPSYRIELGASDSAQISSSATIANDAEDLDAVEMQLVTGAPNVELAHVPSPLAGGVDVATFLRLLGAPPREENARYDSQAMSIGGGSSSLIGYQLGAVEDLGIDLEDVHVLSLEGVTLPRNGSTWRPLRSATVPFEHVYRWDIESSLDDRGRWKSESGSAPMVPPQAWHWVRLVNATDAPWSTGPALMVRDGIALAQDAMPFTPPGQPALVRVARATGLVLDETEQEVTRSQPTVQPGGGHASVVRLKGSLRARNLTGRAIRLEIFKNAIGTLETSDPPATVEALPAGSQQLNPRIRLAWQIDLAPGQERTVTYEYALLARH